MKKSLAWLSVLVLCIVNVPVGQSPPTDTPPTLACEFQLDARTGLDINLQGTDISRTGRLLLFGYDGIGTNEEIRSVVVSTGCGTVFQVTSSTPGNAFTRHEVAAFDGAERVIVEHLRGDGAGNNNRTLKLLNQNTGNVIRSSSNLSVVYGAAFDINNRIDDIRVNSTSADFVFPYGIGVTGGRMARHRYSDLERVFDAGISNLHVVRADEETNVVYGRQHTSNTFVRINASTGALLSTTSETAVSLRPPDRSELSPTTAYIGTVDTGALSYHRINASTFATINGLVTVTDGIIRVGGVNQTATVLDYAIDAQNNLLLCGGLAPSGRSYAAKVRTSDNTQRWNITTTQAGLTGCGFDYVGGFWIYGFAIGGGGTMFYWAKRYTGGDLSQPNPPGTITPSEGAAGGGGPIIDQIVIPFADAWDLSVESVMWLVGIFIVGYVTFKFSQYSKKTIVPAIGAFLGIGAATVLGFFPEWVIFSIIFLIICVAGGRLFGKGDDED